MMKLNDVGSPMWYKKRNATFFNLLCHTTKYFLNVASNESMLLNYCIWQDFVLN